MRLLCKGAAPWSTYKNRLYFSQVALVVKNPPASAGDVRDVGLILGSGRSPGEGNGNPPTPVFLPGRSHGERSPVGYSPWGHKESDMTERLIQRNQR